MRECIADQLDKLEFIHQMYYDTLGIGQEVGDNPRVNDRSKGILPIQDDKQYRQQRLSHQLSDINLCDILVLSMPL